MKHVFFIICLLSTTVSVAQTYTVKRLGLEKGLSNNFVRDIAEDKNGFLWFATEEGLNRLEGSSFFNYYKGENGEPGITGNELNCLLDDPEEPILWIGTQREGLNAYNYKTNTFTAYRHHEEDFTSLITDDITDISPASDGNLWIDLLERGRLSGQTDGTIHTLQPEDTSATPREHGMDYHGRRQRKPVHRTSESRAQYSVT